MADKIAIIAVQENNKTFARLDNEPIGEEELVKDLSFAPEQLGSGFAVLAAIAGTADEDRSVGRALEELIDHVFQEGRRVERELMKHRLGLE